MRFFRVLGLLLAAALGTLIWAWYPTGENAGIGPAKQAGGFLASSQDEAAIPWNRRSHQAQRRRSSQVDEEPELRRSQPGPGSDSMATIRVFGNKSVSAELIAAHIAVPGDTARDEIEALIWNQISSLFTSLGLIGTTIKRLEIGEGEPPNILLEIEEGKFFRYGAVGITGDGEIISATDQLPKAGEPVNYPQINDLRALLQERLADLGYLDAQVVPSIRPDYSLGILDLMLQITHGQRYSVGRISAPAGLSLPLQPGDYYLQGLLFAYLESQGIAAELIRIESDPQSGEVYVTIGP